MGYLVVKVVLAPVLLAQGLFVATTMERLPEPHGERQGVDGQGPRLRLLVLGDSAAAGVGVQTQQEALLGNLVTQLSPHFELHWKLIARTGATSNATLRHLQKIPAEPFDVVVTSLGVNDVVTNKTKQTFLREQQDIITLLKKKFSASQIILLGLPPMGEFPTIPQPLRWYLGDQSNHLDQVLERLAVTEQCDYIKQDLVDDPQLMATDGFHPGQGIYAIWASEVTKYVLRREV
ncbi:MAG: SGNH/GDSL hydrolase family protein [Chloroflexota bacterium]